MAEAKYELFIYDETGTRQFIITDFFSLGYQRIVNNPGLLTFSIPDFHPMALTLVERDWQVEVVRSRASDFRTNINPSNAIAPYVDFGGFIRDEERVADSDGQVTVTYYVVGWSDLLRRAIVAYPPNRTGRTKFVNVAAETICKDIVKYNATTSGTTADGRDRNVPTAGSYLSIETDTGDGNLLDVFLSRTNLLDTLRDIASIGNGDFDVVKTGARAWQFRWYPAQLGTQKITSVVFALNYGNMVNPRLRYQRLEERTVAIVAGQEVNGVRQVETVLGSGYNAATNSYEVYVDGSDVSTNAGLRDRGEARMQELKESRELTFDVLQTPGSLYGLHYFLGDIVTAVFQGVQITQKIEGVTIGFDSSGAETISLDLRNQ